jgi:hypothetical protein
VGDTAASEQQGHELLEERRLADAHLDRHPLHYRAEASSIYQTSV